MNSLDEISNFVKETRGDQVTYRFRYFPTRSTPW